jgi:hypothetical protein
LGLLLFVEPQAMNQTKFAVMIHFHDWTAPLGTDRITGRKILLHGHISFRSSDSHVPRLFSRSERSRVWRPLPRSFLYIAAPLSSLKSKKIPAWAKYPVRYSATPAYSLIGPPARPGYPSISHPTTHGPHLQTTQCKSRAERQGNEMVTETVITVGI